MERQDEYISDLALENEAKRKKPKNSKNEESLTTVQTSLEQSSSLLQCSPYVKNTDVRAHNDDHSYVQACRIKIEAEDNSVSALDSKIEQTKATTSKDVPSLNHQCDSSEDETLTNVRAPSEKEFPIIIAKSEEHDTEMNSDDHSWVQACRIKIEAEDNSDSALDSKIEQTKATTSKDVPSLDHQCDSSEEETLTNVRAHSEEEFPIIIAVKSLRSEECDTELNYDDQFEKIYRMFEEMRGEIENIKKKGNFPAQILCHPPDDCPALPLKDTEAPNVFENHLGCDENFRQVLATPGAVQTLASQTVTVTPTTLSKSTQTPATPGVRTSASQTVTVTPTIVAKSTQTPATPGTVQTSASQTVTVTPTIVDRSAQTSSLQACLHCSRQVLQEKETEIANLTQNMRKANEIISKQEREARALHETLKNRESLLKQYERFLKKQENCSLKHTLQDNVQEPPTPGTVPTSVPQPVTVTPSSTAKSTHNMSSEAVMQKCRNFLATLMKLAAEQSKKMAANVKELIQGLIDGVVLPEDFTTRLQKELNSSPQPFLVSFLKKSLPYLRHSLITKKVTIEGVNPPSPSAYMLLTYVAPGATASQLNQKYPIMWQGVLEIKEFYGAAVQMHYVFGNKKIAPDSLPNYFNVSPPTLSISQRMKLETALLQGLTWKMSNQKEHCILMALPSGTNYVDIVEQSKKLKSGIIAYLESKQAAGIINIQSGTQKPAFVIHVFPPMCEFSRNTLSNKAPYLAKITSDITHLVIIIATV